MYGVGRSDNRPHRCRARWVIPVPDGVTHSLIGRRYDRAEEAQVIAT